MLIRTCFIWAHIIKFHFSPVLANSHICRSLHKRDSKFTRAGRIFIGYILASKACLRLRRRRQTIEGLQPSQGEGGVCGIPHPPPHPPASSPTFRSACSCPATPSPSYAWSSSLLASPWPRRLSRTSAKSSRWACTALLFCTSTGWARH